MLARLLVIGIPIGVGRAFISYWWFESLTVGVSLGLLASTGAALAGLRTRRKIGSRRDRDRSLRIE